MLDDTTDHNVKRSITDATIVAAGIAVPQAAAFLRASLIVVSGWEIGREIEIHGQGQVLGRSALSNTHVDAPSVSRSHARIDRVRDGDQEFFTITDLGSSNGTWVNGARVESAVLNNADRVRMGDVLFKFVLQDEVEAEYHQQVHRLIHYDQLTGLLKMGAFRNRLDFYLRREHNDTPFTLAMTDLDGLKKVNDTFGHLAGRMVVREMGVMMRQSLRPEDIAGLYGGDEAIIVFPDADLASASAVAERLRVTIEKRVFEFQGNTFQVSISQGLAEWPRHGDAAESLIAAADRALYTAKQAGRNCVCTADQRLP